MARELQCHRRVIPGNIGLCYAFIDERVEEPLRWIAPSFLSLDDDEPARGRLLTWCDRSVALPVVVVRQDGRILTRARVPWPAAPGRVFRIPSRMLRDVNRRGGEVTIGLG